jgi:hypothetical protein
LDHREIKDIGVVKVILAAILALEDISAAPDQAAPKDRAVQPDLLGQLADIPVAEDILVVLA